MKKANFIQNVIIVLNSCAFCLCFFIFAVNSSERIPVDKWQAQFKRLRQAVPNVNILPKDLPKKHAALPLAPEPIYQVVEDGTDKGISVSKSTLEISPVLKSMIEDMPNEKTKIIPLKTSSETIQSAFSILDAYKHDPEGSLARPMIEQLSRFQLENILLLFHHIDINNPNIIGDFEAKRWNIFTHKKKFNSIPSLPDDQEPMFTITGKYPEEKSIKISKNTFDISNTLKHLLEDLGNPTEEVFIPIANYSIHIIQPVFSLLELIDKNPKSSLIQQTITLFSLQKLISAINLLQYLDIQDPTIINLFINSLKQRLSGLSNQEIATNKDIIDKLNPHIQRIYQPYRDIIVSPKRIELLKNKGNIPVTNEFTRININFKITTACFSHNGTKIALGKNDGTIVIFDTQSGKELTRFSDDNTPVTVIKFSHDDNLIVTTHEQKNCMITIRNGHTYEKIQSILNNYRDHHITSIAFSPDDTYMISGSHYGVPTLVIWQKDTTNQYKKDEAIFPGGVNPELYRYDIKDFSVDGINMLLENHYTNQFCIRNINKRLNTICINAENPHGFKYLQFSMDGTKIFALDGYIFKAWDAKTYNVITDNSSLANDPHTASVVNLSSDENMCLIEKEGSMHLQNPISNDHICDINVQNLGIIPIPGTTGAVFGFFSHNNDMIALYKKHEINHPLFIVKLLTQKERRDIEIPLKKLPLSDLILKAREVSAQNDKRTENPPQPAQIKIETPSNRPTFFLKALRTLNKFAEQASLALFGYFVFWPAIGETIKYPVNYYLNK